MAYTNKTRANHEASYILVVVEKTSVETTPGNRKSNKPFVFWTFLKGPSAKCCNKVGGILEQHVNAKGSIVQK